jgi:hypothetical protein
VNGAVALGLGDELGTLTAGRRATMLAVAVPPDVADVEEWLVSRVSPADVQRLDSGSFEGGDPKSPTVV